MDDEADAAPVVEPPVKESQFTRTRLELEEAEGGGQERAAPPRVRAALRVPHARPQARCPRDGQQSVKRGTGDARKVSRADERRPVSGKHRSERLC